MARLTRTINRINWAGFRHSVTVGCERLAMVALGALIIATPIEREGDTIYLGLQAVLLACWIVYIAVNKGMRPILAALSFEAVFVVVAVILSYFFSVNPPVQTLSFFLREMAVPMAVTLAVLLSVRLPSPGELSWKAKALFLLLGAMYCWVTLGAFLSANPEASFVGLRREIAPWILAFLSIIHFCSTFRRLRALALAGFAAITLVALAVVAQWAVYRWSFVIDNWQIRNYLVQQHKMILPVNMNPDSPFYILFPFNHYSTLGAFLGIGLGVVFFAGAMLEHKPSRQWVQWSALIVAGGAIAAYYGPALWAVLLTGIVYFSFTNPRYLILVAALALAVVAWRPAMFQKPSPVELSPPDMLEVLWFGNPESAPDPDWSLTTRLIADSPVWGIGYYWRHLRNTVDRIERRENLPRSPLYQHFILQWTAQTGLMGAGLLSLMYALMLWWVTRKWRDVKHNWLQRKAVAAWAGMMLAMLLLAFFTYLLRERIGMMVFTSMGLMVNFLLQSQPLDRK